MQQYSIASVFVPGGMPDVTYVPRNSRNLEERLRAGSKQSFKLITVTGSTKSGKTVLTRKVFPHSQAIWIDGGSIREEDDLWNCILDLVDAYSETSIEDSEAHSQTVGGEVGGQIKLPLVGSGSTKFTGGLSSSKKTKTTRKRTSSPRAAAIRELQINNRPLVIDDFHYLGRDLQGLAIRALKSLIFDGLPVVFIAIPHRRYDAVKVEREMTARLESIDIPSWDREELLQISTKGFPLLNMDVSAPVCERLADESYGSPHLMQEFCKQLAIDSQTAVHSTSPLAVGNLRSTLFETVAEGTGKVIFDKLAKGPRSRTDRLKRSLVQGGTADIYRVTLLALGKIGPGMQTVEYEDLRTTMKTVLKGNIPQAHEVSRVLEKMGAIASSDESSTPVLDWDKEDRKLHITDPFFAFYLKWGLSTRPK